MKMKTNFDITVYRYIGISMMMLTALCVNAQQDSALNRSVTVERDFQPVIQAAGKVATKPAVVETTIEPAPVEYSTYTVQVSPEAAINPMLSQPTRFEPSKPYNGFIRGALGHPFTRLDFGYHLDDGKKSILDVFAHHDGEWCREMMLSKTKVGLNFTHPFSTCDLYFGVNGGNIYYHRYGDLYDPAGPKNNTSLWLAEVFFGVKANAKQDVQYMAQTGYQIFAKANAVSEHQLRTKASFDWHSDAHHVGAKFYMQNNFMQLSGDLAKNIDPSLYNSRHNFRIEPYYAYIGKRVQVHAGVNLDMNIGSPARRTSLLLLRRMSISRHKWRNNGSLSMRTSRDVMDMATCRSSWRTTATARSTTVSRSIIRRPTCPLMANSVCASDPIGTCSLRFTEATHA